MITSLTLEQTAKFPDYVDNWTGIGLDISDIDVEKTMLAIGVMYKEADLVCPTKYEVYDSPFEAITEMKIRYNLDVTPENFIYGAHDASWLAFYSYMQEVLDLSCCEKMQGLIDLAKYVGWVLLYDEMVVLTQKPLHVKFDEDKLSHCEDDFAIKYRDGTGVALWHGTRIPSEWIFDKSSITPEVLLHWSNVEERRCACEIVGWYKVLELLNAVTIDKDGDKTVGKLVEVDLPDSGKEKFLIVHDVNVGKLVGLPVPPEMKTALEANSWTYGIDKYEFKPEFRT